MFLRIFCSLILGFNLIGASKALAQSEDKRREDFYRHEKEEKAYDLEREKGLKNFLKAQAEWEEQRKDDIKADKKRKKTESPAEGGPEYKADRQEKLEDYEQYDKDRKAYM